MAEAEHEGGPGRLYWTRSFSLTARILAVNIIALALVAGSLFYLDSYRNRLTGERFALARSEALIAADGLAAARRFEKRQLLATIGKRNELRLRLYDRNGKLVADSFRLAEPSFALADPNDAPWLERTARWLDRGMDALLGTPPLPDWNDPERDDASAFPEVAAARVAGGVVTRQRLAPDRTPVITAAAPVGSRGEVLLTNRNARDITRSVREARQTLAIVVGTALLISTQLSLFLAHTIVRPLRALVRAAVRVRLGRERSVIVPRLPERRDEIGLLARAISDMTEALRKRIDAVEAFAADVAHEIKNPLASLRSAVESLETVKDPELRNELQKIAQHDVRRIDRLVTEIADASRIDAELSRATFEPVDMARLVAAQIAARQADGRDHGRRVSFARHGGPWVVAGVPLRLERVLENLLDNAVSFSPPSGEIVVSLIGETNRVVLRVEDHGPGIPAETREQVFARFHSLRPEDEAFGGHSGLGLAIARTIIEAQDGTLIATDRPDGQPGACLIVDLPTWRQEAE